MGEYAGETIHRVQVPPHTFKEEAGEALLPVRDLLVNDDDPFRKYRGASPAAKIKLLLFDVFPILSWLSTYKREYIIRDVIAGLTIASLAVPQDIGYASLAHLPAVNGLYSSFVPPLMYAALGTSRHVAIGPVAVVSLLLGTLLKDQYDPVKQKSLYYDLAITSTFFAGVIQLAMGLLRLGFIIDFLSHAVIVGFMGGAAVTIGLSQLKAALGYKTFTTKTDIVSVFNSVANNTEQFQYRAFLIFIFFLLFLYVLKMLTFNIKKGRVGRFLFFLNATGPLICVIIATACVYGTRADKHGVKVVGHIKRGLNPSSLKHLHFSGHDGIGTKGLKIGIVAGLIALTESIAIARTFAALKGYHIDGNQEMIALGSGNLIGSLTSCYVSTGSFSRSAVNYAAGAETAMTQIVMAIVLLLTLVAITPLFKYLPSAVLSSIIISAVTTLVNLPAAYRVWKTDKLDFIALLGAFFGVVFVSIEIGLLIAVCISALKVLVTVARPHLAVLGNIAGTTIWRSLKQYPDAVSSPGVLVARVDSNIYFANANFIRERVFKWAVRWQQETGVNAKGGVQSHYVVLELTPVHDIDTTGIHAFEELLRMLHENNIQLALSNPSRQVLWRLQTSGFLEEIGSEWLFVSVHEAVRVCERLAGERHENGSDV